MHQFTWQLTVCNCSSSPTETSITLKAQIIIVMVLYCQTLKFNIWPLIHLRKEGNVLFNDALNTFFIYGYMASDIWLRTILIVRKETRCRHIGNYFRLTARVLLYAPSHRQDSTYHSLCYTSRGPLAGTRNSSMGPPHEGSIRQPIAP